MRSKTYGFVAIIAILLVSLVYQMQRRHAAEETLDRLVSARPQAIVSSRAPTRVKDQESAVRALIEENRALRAKADGQIAPAVSEGAAKIAALKDLLARLPEQGIPELQLTTEADWYAAADGPLDSMDDFRAALSKLRAAAEARFAVKTQPALSAYLSAHGNVFPKDLTEIQPYFDGPIDNMHGCPVMSN